ncbi:Phytoene synthase [hydrothermal vent metagenome]|uniref:Phytoene synthase n=1 Tax=hydrothermal vent metagenome TaxID=652676 RepID=A0A3B0ZJF7_9ZZZZ
MTPEQYCQEKTAKSGSSFYYSFLFLPPVKRKAITAVYAFCREVDDIVDDCTNIEIAERKLAWWQDEISRLYQQQAQHPVTKALGTTLQNFDLPEEYFQEIIDGMKMDLNIHRYQTFSELSLYCYRVASVVGLIAAEIFGYKDKLTLKYAHNLGMAFQLTNILRDVKEDTQRNRIYIPLEELEQFSVTEQDLLNNINTKNSTKLFIHQANRAHKYYDKAMSFLPELDRYQQCTGIIMSEIYKATLNKIQRENYCVLEKRVSLPALKKLWLAWKTVRRENKRHKKLSI